MYICLTIDERERLTFIEERINKTISQITVSKVVSFCVLTQFQSSRCPSNAISTFLEIVMRIRWHSISESNSLFLFHFCHRQPGERIKFENPISIGNINLAHNWIRCESGRNSPTHIFQMPRADAQNVTFRKLGMSMNGRSYRK